MKVKAYGTRGSSPVARPQTSVFGGNTTCFRFYSDCLPSGTALLLDAGSGLVPASRDLAAEGIRRILILMTHYHHDHTQGFPLAPHTYFKDVTVQVYGPKEYGVGPREMLDYIMQAPFFPVDFARVASHFECHALENIGCEVMVIHPDEGPRVLRVDDFERLQGEGSAGVVGLSRAALEESLVIRMHKTVHPEYTVSYRFEERPTGKVMVVLTDHENTDSLPLDLRNHIRGADLLVQDAQYDRSQYEASRAGFGHGTGDYAARVMKETGAARLGHTHHDPSADDDQVEAIVAESRAWLRSNGAPARAENVFACADYQEIEI